MSRNTSYSGDRVAFSPEAKRTILDRDGGQCVAALDDGSRCAVTEGLQADHVIGVAEAKLMGWTETEYHDISNGQTLCVEHHDLKTEAEKKRGIDRWQQNKPKRKRPSERHPGLR